MRHVGPVEHVVNDVLPRRDKHVELVHQHDSGSRALASLKVRRELGQGRSRLQPALPIRHTAPKLRVRLHGRRELHSVDLNKRKRRHLVPDLHALQRTYRFADRCRLAGAGHTTYIRTSTHTRPQCIASAVQHGLELLVTAWQRLGRRAHMQQTPCTPVRRHARKHSCRHRMQRVRPVWQRRRRVVALAIRHVLRALSLTRRHGTEERRDMYTPTLHKGLVLGTAGEAQLPVAVRQLYVPVVGWRRFRRRLSLSLLVCRGSRGIPPCALE